ncbi:Protein of unknown function [Gryllus bimaculatus]|nr:Protein of unknown function [Gryllus bimaculatus]
MWMLNKSMYLKNTRRGAGGGGVGVRAGTACGRCEDAVAAECVIIVCARASGQWDACTQEERKHLPFQTERENCKKAVCHGMHDIWFKLVG